MNSTDIIILKKLHDCINETTVHVHEIIDKMKVTANFFQIVMRINKWLGSKCVIRHCNIVIIIAINTIYFSYVYNIFKWKEFYENY